jgi:hypothetical protein
MESKSRMIDLPLKLRISEESQHKLVERAAASGIDLGSYVSAMVEQNVRNSFSLEELSGPVYARFVESGTTADQLDEELEQAKHELRAERRARGIRTQA